MKNIGKKAKVGVLYNTATRIASTLLQLSGTIILARLISPEGFGIVATGLLVIGFATKFGQFGFNIALIQRKENISTNHVNTLFTIDLLFKVILFSITYHTTPYIADYFAISELNKALPIIAFYMILECLSTTPLTLMQRNMNFKATSIILTSERFLTTLLAIIMALCGLGYWSLIHSKLIAVTIAGFLAAKTVGWRPKISYDHKAAKELFSFGILVFLRNLFRYGSENVDYFLISKFLGTAQLGFYEKSFNLMKLPQKRITKGINTVAFSAFSRIQDQPDLVRLAFRKLVLATSLLSYPILATIAFVAPLLVPLALGENWAPSIVPLQIMCAAGIIYSVDPFLNSVLTATGFVKWTLYRRLVEFILVGTGAFFAVGYGINCVSSAILIVSFLIMILMLCIVTKKSSITWTDYLVPQVPAFITSITMLVIIQLVTIFLVGRFSISDVVLLIVQLATAAITYICLHLLFRFALVKSLFDELTGDAKSAGTVIMRKLPFLKSRIFGPEVNKVTS